MTQNYLDQEFKVQCNFVTLSILTVSYNNVSVHWLKVLHMYIVNVGAGCF